MPLFRQAKFLKSARVLPDLPPESRCEIAFAGRSNSGKSSVINTLADQRQLARVSKTPGRTQLLNFFALGEGRFLVDLPGYGYARVPAATRAPWGRVLGDYLITRDQLAGLALVMDVRHQLTRLDWALLEWFRPTGRPVHVLLTKADKLSRSAALKTLRKIGSTLAAASPNWTAQLFSSLKRIGIEDAEVVLGSWLAEDGPQVHDPAGLGPAWPAASRRGTKTATPKNKKPRA